ncbi:putative nuclease HARBI1 [Scyliorhinus torazame]|uniref:putative nuclease HARBI1 n=1 Tax=Scyliorhinus torazame TaxID=75743 RepID=UPI003B596C3C
MPYAYANMGPKIYLVLPLPNCRSCVLLRDRVYQDRISYEDMTEVACRSRIRMSHGTVAHICNLLAHLEPRGTGGGHALPVRVKITVALNFFATGSFQSPSGDLCGISQASVHRGIQEVTDGLSAVAGWFIDFPEDRAQQAAWASQFIKMAGILMVQGVVDGVHVNLRAPPRDRGVFINRKGAYSINVQVVCDQGMRIMHVCAQYPGNVHDAFILAQSFIPTIFEGHPPWMRGWLLGDMGYPLKPWLMTPIRRPQTNAERRYNEAHAATRDVVGRCFGLLKMRFRCLDRSGGALQYDPDRVGRIVLACCVLHNIAQQRGDVMEEEGAREAEEAANADHEEEEEGVVGEEEGGRAGGRRGIDTIGARETAERPHDGTDWGGGHTMR